MTYIDTREDIAPDLYIEVMQDEYPMSPREWDNLSVIYGQHRNYTIGDGEPPADESRALERGGIRLLYRWLRRCKDVVAFTKLGMYDHSGVTFYAVPLGNNGHHAFDSAGWDSGVVGYAYVTQERADYLGAPADSLDRQLAGEVEEYSDWASGNVWAYVIKRKHAPDCDVTDCPHDETLDSCGGFIGDPEYALAEARSAAQSYA